MATRVVTSTCLTILSLIIITASSGNSRKSSHLTLHRKLPSGAFVAVFDDLLSDDIQSSLKNYANFFLHWETRSQGVQQCIDRGQDRHSQSRGHCQGSLSEATPWSAPGDPQWFSGTSTWRHLLEAASMATNGTTQALYPYSIRAELLKRGDNVAPGEVASSHYSSELAVRIFLVPKWQMNDYGDMSFYTSVQQNRTNGSRYDILLTVRPHPGRVVLWDASVPTLYRPPSMGYLQSLLSVSVLLTSSRDKFDTACQEWKEWDQMKAKQMEQSFPQLPDPVGPLDIGSHLVRSFADSKGRKGMVFDGLFDEGHLEALATYLIENPRVRPFPYGVEKYEESDNVAWIKTFDALEFAKSSAWEVLSQVANFVGGEPRTWHPYDVSVNVVHSADHPRIHEDCEEWENEYTMVMYLNRDLEAGDYGETIFYNKEPLDSYSRKLYKGISMYDYDAIGAVNPKYGRLAIFNGLTSHSARPPSTAYSGPRYTFAVKVAATRKIAIMKKLRENLEESSESNKFHQTLAQELHTMAKRGRPMERSEEWLEAELKRVWDAQNKALHDAERELLAKL